MRAGRLQDRGDLRVDQVEEFPLGEEQVRVDIAYTGICGSDLHEYEAGAVPIRAEDSGHIIPAGVPSCPWSRCTNPETSLSPCRSLNVPS
jgi:(R,R)-butanediol dehydrogenase/meso-butanediol dehydrogenase/diacetyl reductase